MAGPRAEVDRQPALGRPGLVVSTSFFLASVRRGARRSGAVPTARLVRRRPVDRVRAGLAIRFLKAAADGAAGGEKSRVFINGNLPGRRHGAGARWSFFSPATRRPARKSSRWSRVLPILLHLFWGVWRGEPGQAHQQSIGFRFISPLRPRRWRSALRLASTSN